MPKLLFICNDFIGNAMAGPGIRYWEMARALERKGHSAAILSRHLEEGFSSNITFVGKASFSNLVRWIWRSDYVVQTGRPLSLLLTVLFRKKSIFDQYDPVIFELLEQKPVGWAEKLRLRGMLFLWKARQRLILRWGQQFLVANEKQKDLLIGQLAILGQADKLASVTIMPFGLPDVKPYKNRSVLRGSKIRDTDFLLIWGGGIWDWFDPFTLLKALSILKARREDIKVYFPGINPPSPDTRKMTVTDAFLTEARSLGLLATSVFVNDGWTAYADRADYLLEADAGITLHRDSLETRFAFRTRVLDYLWAGLPIIASQGDSWAEVIDRKGLGITVVPGDVDGLVSAIEKLAGDGLLRKQCRENVQAVAKDYVWNKLTESLKLS
jgi:glycosyltransferase involved in cell wall biosynthesis